MRYALQRKLPLKQKGAVNAIYLNQCMLTCVFVGAYGNSLFFKKDAEIV